MISNLAALYVNLIEPGLKILAVAVLVAWFVLVPQIQYEINKQAVLALEQALASDMAGRDDHDWSADCPDDANLTNAGSTFTCTFSEPGGLAFEADLMIDSAGQLQIVESRDTSSS